MDSAFASVGPCFVGPILSDHHFDAQMEYLRMANTHYTVLVLPVQQLLFDSLDNQLKSGAPATKVKSTISGMLGELREDIERELGHYASWAVMARRR